MADDPAMTGSMTEQGPLDAPAGSGSSPRAACGSIRWGPLFGLKSGCTEAFSVAFVWIRRQAPMTYFRDGQFKVVGDLNDWRGFYGPGGAGSLRGPSGA